MAERHNMPSRLKITLFPGKEHGMDGTAELTLGQPFDFLYHQGRYLDEVIASGVLRSFRVKSAVEPMGPMGCTSKSTLAYVIPETTSHINTTQNFVHN